MGFFSKIFKGVKKVFKKIGKGIKKVAGKIGKFMGKIGIVGQIAMAFILPGIGSALASTLGNVGTWASAVLANPATGGLMKGVAHIVNGAAKFAGTVGRTFQTVTSAVKNYAGEMTKTLLNKVPGINVENAATNLFGDGGAFDIARQKTGKTWETGFGSEEWWESFKPEPVEGFSPLDSTTDVMDRKFTDPTSPDFIEEGTQGVLPEDSSLLQGPVDAPEAKDFITDEVADAGKDYQITEKALAAAGTEGLKEVGKSLLTPEPEVADFRYRGSVVEVPNMYAVGPAQMNQMPEIGYGTPMLQYDAMYRPTSTWATSMRGFT